MKIEIECNGTELGVLLREYHEAELEDLDSVILDPNVDLDKVVDYMHVRDKIRWLLENWW